MRRADVTEGAPCAYVSYNVETVFLVGRRVATGCPTAVFPADLGHFPLIIMATTEISITSQLTLNYTFTRPNNIPYQSFPTQYYIKN